MTDPLRRASDTRADPGAPGAAGAPTPGRQKLDVMGRAATEVARTTVPEKGYGPNLGPTGAPPLTESQAMQLLDAAEYPKSLNKYKKLVAQAVVKESESIPKSERRVFSTLLKLSKHPCAKQVLLDPQGFQKLTELFDRIVPSIRNWDTERDGEPIISEEGAINGIVGPMARILALGFDVASPGHFIFDKFGNVYDVEFGSNRGRYESVCIPYLKSIRPWTPSPSEVGYGGKKTRKHKRRNKKTLRRRKVRRNVH